MIFRPRLTESSAKSGPINTLRFGEGGGPEARNWAKQALAESFGALKRVRVLEQGDAALSFYKRVSG